MKNNCLLVSIEGSDGAGKETQTTLLRTSLQAEGKKVVSVSFPRYNMTCGGKMLFEAFKSPRADHYKFAKVDSRSASLFYASDRLESLPWLLNLIKDNDVLIFDRYVDSNLLHQGGKLQTSEERKEFAEWLYGLEHSLNGMPHSDISIYLSLPFEISIERARLRAELAGKQPDVLEVDESYMKSSHDGGQFYAELLHWKIVNCIVDGRELTEHEIHRSVLGFLP